MTVESRSDQLSAETRGADVSGVKRLAKLINGLLVAGVS